MQNDLKHELHHIISGKSQVSYGALIQTIASYLDNGAQSSDEIESSKQNRKIKITQNVISSLPRQHQSQDGQDP